MPGSGARQKLIRHNLGEIAVEVIPPIVADVVHGICRIVWRADGNCYITSLVNGCMVDCYLRGAWLDTGRQPDFFAL